jgi:hypothetical protein
MITSRRKFANATGNHPFLSLRATKQRANPTTRSVLKFQILNMFIILNTDITSLRATQSRGNP